MIRLILIIIILYLVGRYVLPRDWTRIRDIWLHGAIYTSIVCLLLAKDEFVSLKLNELYLSIAIGLFWGMIWVYLIYRYEKKLISINFSFKKISVPQFIVWTIILIYLHVMGVKTGPVMLLAIAIYMVVGLFGTLLLERKFKKEIRLVI